MPACDIDQHTFCAVQADFIQERVGNGLFGSLAGAIFARSLARAHHSFAHFIHNGAHIGKV